MILWPVDQADQVRQHQLLEHSSPCADPGPGLKKVKLGIEGSGEEKSSALGSHELPNEKPSDKEQGVWSTKKDENDDLQA
ncbi:hypothetical protein Leryth_008902 [Lithospermum erythrorhizon]|nr:hypothetical protein Leryth_008902 [Lithospermum erythrorhizon]